MSARESMPATVSVVLEPAAEGPGTMLTCAGCGAREWHPRGKSGSVELLEALDRHLQCRVSAVVAVDWADVLLGPSRTAPRPQATPTPLAATAVERARTASKVAAARARRRREVISRARRQEAVREVGADG